MEEPRAGESLELYRASSKRWPPPRPLWEHVIVGIVVGLVVLWLASVLYDQIDHTRRIRLHHQLWRIRNAVLMYESMMGEAPKSLEELPQTFAVDPKSGQRFPLLEGITFDAQGQAIDPYGNAYRYDRAAGAVTSGSPCCQTW